MTIEQWRFFSVPHLQWHGTSVCKRNLWGPVTITFVAVHYPFLRLGCVAAGIRTPDLLYVWRTTAPPQWKECTKNIQQSIINLYARHTCMDNIKLCRNVILRTVNVISGIRTSCADLEIHDTVFNFIALVCCLAVRVNNFISIAKVLNFRECWYFSE